MRRLKQNHSVSAQRSISGFIPLTPVFQIGRRGKDECDRPQVVRDCQAPVGKLFPYAWAYSMNSLALLSGGLIVAALWATSSVGAQPLPQGESDVPLSSVVWTDAAFDRSARRVTSDFFGMHLYRGIDAEEWPTVPFQTWRLHDAGTRWDELQPERDRWEFDNLDTLITLAEQQSVDTVLVLGQTPAWASARPDDPSPYDQSGLPAEPANLEDWRAYVRTVATRYRGQIDYYELWNEANFRWFYTGDIPTMVELAAVAYREIKEIDPQAQVLSPSVIAGDYDVLEQPGDEWLAEYFAAGGDRYTDIVAAHFYLPRDLPPEWMVPQIEAVQQVMAASSQSDKPLWNTETGFGRADMYPIDGDRAVGYVGRSHLVQWAAGVDRFQWYAWQNFNFVGLRMTEEDGRMTAAAEAFGKIQEWLLDARMGLCQIASDRTRTCPIARDNGDRGWILWNPNQTVHVSIPNWLQATHVRQLTGEHIDIHTGSVVSVGEVPVLVERLH